MFWGGDSRSHLISQPRRLSLSLNVPLHLRFTLSFLFLRPLLTKSRAGPVLTEAPTCAGRLTTSRIPSVRLIRAIACCVSQWQRPVKAWLVSSFTRGVGLTSAALTVKLKGRCSVSAFTHRVHPAPQRCPWQHRWWWLISVSLFILLLTSLLELNVN